MSSSEFRQEVPEISDRSAIPELIGLLHSSFREKEFKLVERMLISREEEFKRQMKKEQKERGLLEKIHGESELEKLEMQEEINRLKSENFEMQEELKELKRQKQEAEETAQLYSQKFPGYEERIRYLEKAVASMLGMDASEIGTSRACNSSENDLQKEGNRNLDCEQTVDNATNHCENTQTSYGAQSPRNGPMFETNSSHQEKRSCNRGTLEMRKDLFSSHSNAEIGIEDVCDAPKVETNVLREKENDSSYRAASTSINRICDKEFHDKEQLVPEKSTQVVSPSGPISDRPRSPIIVEIIESDDEAPGEENPFDSNTCTSGVNSCKKGVTFMESGMSECPTQAEDENKSNVMSNPVKNLAPNRKRSLTVSDDTDSYPIGKQKMKTVRESLHDGENSIFSNCPVKLGSAATGSQSILPCALVQMVKKRCQEKAGADCSPQTVSRKFDFDSTDDSSDDSSTDLGDINNMIAILRKDSGKSQKT